MALLARQRDWHHHNAGDDGSSYAESSGKRLRIVLFFWRTATMYFWSPFKAGMVRHDGGHYPMAGLFLSSGLLVLQRDDVLAGAAN